MKMSFTHASCITLVEFFVGLFSGIGAAKFFDAKGPAPIVAFSVIAFIVLEVVWYYIYETGFNDGVKKERQNKVIEAKSTDPD